MTTSPRIPTLRRAAELVSAARSSQQVDRWNTYLGQLQASFNTIRMSPSPRLWIKPCSLPAEINTIIAA